MASSEQHSDEVLPPGAGASRARRIIFLTLSAAGLVAIVWAVVDSARLQSVSAREIPIIKDVPDFSMTDQDGQPISKADLSGTPWVADFVFTRCPGPCPRMSLRMLAVQRELQRRGLDFKLVTFTLDPENDRPPVLKKYAERFKADETCWRFVTCDDQDEMWNLAIKGFFQSVLPGDDDHTVNHSTYFIIVDADGRIRSAHLGIDPDADDANIVARIADDVALLARDANAS